MSQHLKSLDEIYTLTKLFSCEEILLSAWSQNNKGEFLVIYARSNEFIYYYFTEEKPVIKQIPWFSDALHTPISIDFSPSGIFLLVLSVSCHLYILPILSILDSTTIIDACLNLNDLTIHTYPFSIKAPKTKFKSKSSYSSNSVISSLCLQSSTFNNSNNSKNSGSNDNNLYEFTKNENVTKLKNILNCKCRINPSAVCWWQCMSNSQDVGIIGTDSGDILFVDLTSGFKFAETNVKGEIKKLSVCQDTNHENVFLLITVENNEQYKMILEQRLSNYVWCEKQNFNTGDTDADVDNSNACSGSGNVLPSTRARLQGLKQMSAEKLASLKHKLVETRSKIGAKQGVAEDVSGKCYRPPPENLGSIIGETMMSLQHIHDGYVLAGYYAQSQLLTLSIIYVHTMNLDVVPLFVHKLPLETDEILLCDQVIYTTLNHKTTLQVLSSKLTETRIDQNNDFNTESILGTWDLKAVNNENPHHQKFFKEPKYSITKPDLIPENVLNDTEEKIIKLYKKKGKTDTYNLTKEYNLEKAEEELPDDPKIENCIVVTNRSVYIIELKSNMTKMALDLILETRELEKAEKICTIYGVNLQKLLELAGDIKLAAMEFSTAIALYKLSKCGLLKSIVKLACGNHCNQVLHYSTMLMANSITDISLTERIHLSNLILMAFTQQILKTENKKILMDKFLNFLRTNNYFDEVLAVSVTGQSLLFSCLHELIVNKGLILDGYNVIIKLMERFGNSKVLDWSLNKNDFWKCATEADLIEAMVIKSTSFPTYVEYVLQHLNSLEVEFLNKLLQVLDPTAPAIRPLANLFKKKESFDNDDTQITFTFGKLVELFLFILIFKMEKTKTEKEDYEREFLLLSNKHEAEANSILKENENFGVGDAFNDDIWPIRKDIQANERFAKKVETILSCGFGHTALIRNGSVYTWGQSSKGCLGHGPTMSRYSSPAPISWLNCFKLEVSVVSCGKFHTAALTNNGVYTWGCSKYGQLGLGGLKGSPHPRLIRSLANENVITVSCGQYHTLALTNQGSVYSWGWGVHGQLGHGTIDDHRYPKFISSLKEHFIIGVAAGHGHSIVLTEKGHVYSFGSNVFGQLGTGTNTKHSMPVLVKGFNGKVINIATGYFHSLAVSESNTLYTWGSSPQCLRFQAQARKRSRLSQNQNGLLYSSDSEISKTFQQVKDQIPSEFNNLLDKAELEQHLSPSLVDTSNVTGRIIQISCGCHHSALTTDVGELYTWGRSIDGQLGNGSHREVHIPTQINENGFKTDYVSCGCEFTAAVEKHTGKIFCWGNNALGQLAIPVKESATKSLDGKLVILKSCKRIVRLLDRNASSNSIDTPREIPGIPSPTFTYHTLRKFMTSATQTLSCFDPDYCHRSFHFVIENYHSLIDMSLIFKKCLEHNNFQGASKISLLQKKYAQSVICQFKALQNLPKYHCKSRWFSQKQKSHQEKKSKESLQTEICLFTVEGGHEDLYDDSQSDFTMQRKEKIVLNDKENIKLKYEEDNFITLRNQYIEHAKYILESYLNMYSNKTYEDIDLTLILETGIQFWTAEKLPMPSLEDFLLEKINDVFYDLGYFLFCVPLKEGPSVLEQFTSSFLIILTSKILNKVEKNECTVEYLEAMSRILTSNENVKTSALKRKGKEIKKKKQKSETYVETIKTNLEYEWANEKYVKISYEDIMRDCTYFFSCGHFHSVTTFKEDCKLFNEFNDENISKKLVKLFDFFENENQGDFACPSCVRNYFK